MPNKTEKVENYPEYLKVDKAYIINTDKNAYQAALTRKNNTKKVRLLEQRLDCIEGSLEQILLRLQELTHRIEK